MRMTQAIEAFPFDACMPQLQRAADGTAMRRLLREHARAAWPLQVAIEDCRVTRIRYRRHKRCSLQYELTLREGDIPRRAWVSGSLYADPRRARLARRLPGADFIPELGMVVSVFPVDARLPQAATIMAAGDAQLRDTVVRACGGPDWQVESWVSEPVRYSERLSLVARYTVRASHARTGQTVERVFYVKCYRDGDSARRMFAQADALARYSAHAAIGVHVQPPLACLDHLHAVVTEAAAGRSLAEIIARGDRDETLEAAREAARALARFNVSTAPMPRRYHASDCT
jgi:hypothetical protein